MLKKNFTFDNLFLLIVWIIGVTAFFIITLNRYTDFQSTKLLEHSNNIVVEGILNLKERRYNYYTISITPNNLPDIQLTCNASARKYSNGDCYLPDNPISELSGKQVKIITNKLPKILWYENPLPIIKEITYNNKIYYGKNILTKKDEVLLNNSTNIFLIIIFIAWNLIFFFLFYVILKYKV